MGPRQSKPPSILRGIKGSAGNPGLTLAGNTELDQAHSREKERARKYKGLEADSMRTTVQNPLDMERTVVDGEAVLMGIGRHPPPSSN